jgi:hypothetical protein
MDIQTADGMRGHIVLVNGKNGKLGCICIRDLMYIRADDGSYDVELPGMEPRHRVPKEHLIPCDDGSGSEGGGGGADEDGEGDGDEHAGSYGLEDEEDDPEEGEQSEFGCRGARCFRAYRLLSSRGENSA